MRVPELENWIIQILKKFDNSISIEDDRVEFKTKWPNDIDRTARQIAGQANAVRAEKFLWIIGVDESQKQICGISNPSEVSNWYSSIKSRFDNGICPNLQHDIVVHYDNNQVIGLLFAADRPPYAIKNPEGGRISREVPWRKANSTITAKRTDLLNLLLPIIQKPKIDILEDKLILSQKSKEDTCYSMYLNCEAYITTNNSDITIIPFHKCKTEIIAKSTDTKEFEIGNLSLSPRYNLNMRTKQKELNSLTIDKTPTELIVNKAGFFYIRGDTTIQNSSIKNIDSIQLKILIETARNNKPVVINKMLTADIKEEDEDYIKKWS